MAALKNAPIRLRGFYGAAKAAEMSGETKKAREYFDKLASLARKADSDRPELRETKPLFTRICMDPCKKAG